MNEEQLKLQRYQVIMQGIGLILSATLLYVLITSRAKAEEIAEELEDQEPV